MPSNSPLFLLVFLPITLAGFFLLARFFGRNAAIGPDCGRTRNISPSRRRAYGHPIGCGGE